MTAGVKYGLARLGLFVVCAVPAMLLLPGLDPLLRLLIALAVSAVLALFLLRGLRDQAAESYVTGRDRRRREKASLRSALAGDEGAERRRDDNSSEAGD